MLFTLQAEVKLLTINKAFITLRSGSRVRSKDYVNFSKAIASILKLKTIEFSNFNKYFDYSKHQIHAELIYYTPSIFTKDGKISKSSGDIGNMEKCLTDCVLIGSIDDSCITRWILEKKYAEKHSFKLSLEIVDR
jgi:Holliday junction resolvase RusA-like endonuclease